MMILQSGEARNSEIYDWDRIDEREAIALDTMPFSYFLLDFFVETWTQTRSTSHDIKFHHTSHDHPLCPSDLYVRSTEYKQPNAYLLCFTIHVERINAFQS